MHIRHKGDIHSLYINMYMIVIKQLHSEKKLWCIPHNPNDNHIMEVLPHNDVCDPKIK